MVDRREQTQIGFKAFQLLISAPTLQECDQEINTKLEFGRSTLLLDDLMEWLTIIGHSCPWLLAQFGQTVIELIEQTKTSLIQLQTLRLKQYSEDEFISSNLFIYIGINVDNQRIFINLRGFPTPLAGEFVEFIRENRHEMSEIFSFYDRRVKPKLANIFDFDLKQVFCNYDLELSVFPTPFDIDWV